MSKNKGVQEQVEAILQEQISLLRVRAKECSRQFNHQRYDELTAEYVVLENKLKTLIAPIAVPKEEVYAQTRSETETETPTGEPTISDVPEAVIVGGASDGGSNQRLNWTRVRQHNS